MRARLAAVTAAGALLLAGCSSATGGHGHAEGPSSPPATSHSDDFPSTSSAPSTPSTPASNVTSSPPLTPEQRRQQLQASAPGSAVVLVPVPGGYEAASFDQRGAIRFWTQSTAGGPWRALASSRYPYSSAIGGPNATGTGALLRGMTHATFIVHGLFSGDGTGNAVAFTTGASGWGVIKAERNGNIGPSGQPVGTDQIGLSFDFAFQGGLLQTKDCPPNGIVADCGKDAITKLWVWTGQDFRRA